MGSRATILLAGLLVQLSGSAACATNDFRLAVGPGPNQQVELSWSLPAGNLWYSLESRTSLTSDAWALAEPVDDWPTNATNWWIDARDTAFFRGKAAERVTIVSTSLLGRYTQVDIIDLMFEIFSTAPLPARYAVDLYRIEYTTFDPRGLSVRASGVLAMPGSGALAAALVSYQHGTVFRRDRAPSGVDSLDRAYSLILASDGYAVCAADYLGLGSNAPPLHPYLHARSEAIAGVDMLRAARTFISNNVSVALSGKLFLMGYSQGGHATLALQRELEQYHAAEFPVTASAAMAGPHDLSGTMTDAMLSGAASANPAYVPYLLFGYNGVYGFYDSVSDVLASPYDVTLPPLFDGEHSASEISAFMPAVPMAIFKPEYLAAFANDADHPLRRALRANDTYRWTPLSPTKLYHCAADSVVPKQNSIVAHSNFVSRGAASVWLEDPAPTLDHAEGAIACLLAAKSWFDTLR